MYERILDLIQAEDVDTLFGIPDPSFFGMFIEAERRGMRVISPHHEQAAALTADGLYRMTGKPVVLCMNKGPGVANVLAGVNFMLKENVPAVCRWTFSPWKTVSMSRSPSPRICVRPAASTPSGSETLRPSI